MRIACARVADLPLAAEHRAHPELCGRPFAIANGAGGRAELFSVSREAVRFGVRPGDSVAHARSLCSELAVRVASPALEQAARDALLDAAFGCSPRAALAPRSGGVFASEAIAFVDAAGSEALFHSEAGFATALAARIGALGLPADVAVASSRDVARIAARHLASSGPGEAGRVLVLTPDRERAFLAPLSIDLLDPDDALAEALTRFGVHTVRDLLALPRRGLATRLGAGVLELVQRAENRAVEAPLPEARDARLVEAIDLEAPIDRLEPLLFVLQGLLSRLIERLDARHLGCGDLELSLDLEGGARDARRIGVAAPCSDLRVLVRLARHALEARGPTRRGLDAPVVCARIATRGAPLRRDQLDLFCPAGPAPAALGETLAALQSLCGDARVGSPLALDTHHPDAFELGPFAANRLGGEADAPPARATFTAALALRALRPPVPARVRRDPQGLAAIRSAVANGRVVRCAGPWRTTGGWWAPEERFAFDHFDIQSEDGVVVRLRFDHVRREWQIDAVYD